MVGQAIHSSKHTTYSEHRFAQQGRVAVPGGHVWFGVCGEGSKPPLLAVHGGPGLPHDYLLPSMAEFAAVDRRPVILYDQLGCGDSDRPLDPTLWRIDRFREELACVVHTLELSQYHLWGHSWGAQLALNHAATKPAGLLSLTLAGPVIDIPNYRSDLERLVAQLPPVVQTAIRNESVDTVEYSRAVNAFYRAHLHTMSPWPASWSAALSPDRFGQQTYETMIGVDELHYTGALRDVDDSTLLPHVAAPMGIHCGSTDIATPQRCEQYRLRAGDAELEVFEGSSHAFFDEERSFYLERLQAFLLRCESTH